MTKHADKITLTYAEGRYNPADARPAPDDLWPIIPMPTIRAPVTILREQASYLGQRTQNILIGDVRSLAPGERDPFRYSFAIRCSCINNYTFVLLTISHDTDLYPLEILGFEGPTVEAESEKAFIDLLRGIFRSERTMKVIVSLLAQSTS